ncbi:hypothetical protein S780_25080 [Salmonella enterica]|nr:hypothetical protein [Salmonella enterica subsp. enterica]MID14171.1 hypothetical protein [Salmonella enterica]
MNNEIQKIYNNVDENARLMPFTIYEGWEADKATFAAIRDAIPLMKTEAQEQALISWWNEYDSSEPLPDTTSLLQIIK